MYLPLLDDVVGVATREASTLQQVHHIALAVEGDVHARVDISLGLYSSYSPLSIFFQSF